LQRPARIEDIAALQKKVDHLSRKGDKLARALAQQTTIERAPAKKAAAKKTATKKAAARKPKAPAGKKPASRGKKT
jgi:hypothetical protein